MRNVKLTLQYDGTCYQGWQLQPGKKTVCGALVEKLKIVLNHQVNIHASSRTDSGTHALCQVVNFKTSSLIPPDRLLAALNGLLPWDIAVSKAEEAHDGFHACRDAKSRLYTYTIRNLGCRSPFDRLYSYFFPYKLDVSLMQEASAHLRGTHDFSAFKSARGEKLNRIRKISHIKVKRRREYVLVDVEADGFLTYMARNIAGTLLEAGRGKISPDAVKDILDSRDRKTAGPTLPARGLCLMNVEYG